MPADFQSREEKGPVPDAPMVLIVDDDSKNLLAIESVLACPAFGLIKAQTGANALLELMNRDFAAIVLDVKMPDISGIDLARMIKQRKRSQHIPIIFLTAHYREDQDAILGYDVGAVDYLTKPVNPAVLRSKVNVFVDLFKKTRDLAAMNHVVQAAKDALHLANMELATRNKALEREVEERKRRIQAEEANDAKDRFLAMLSHELRTPLSPIIHAVTLLEEGECPPDLRENIAIIRRNVRLEVQLIDDLLDIARIRNGKLLLELQPVNLHDVLRQALEICGPDFTARHIHVEAKLEVPNAYVQGDPARLQQVFWNLLANAAKFSPENGVIELRTFVAGGGDRIGIEIADHGIGIAPEKIEHIFDAFEQAARPTHSGLGLGLAICKALVEKHGGEIAAHSDGINCGTKLTVHLPCAASNEAPSATPQQHLPSLKGLRLLVVEDHDDTLETLKQLLIRHGCVVRTASSMAQALEIICDYQFDVLVSDIGLPDGRGTDLLERIEQQQGHRPLAIAMSGFGMEDDLERSLQAGFSEHLTKPIEFSALHHSITRLASMLNTSAK